MAIIAPSSMTGSGSKTITVTILSASDTLVYKKGPAIKQTLILNNVTAGPFTPLILGTGATTFPKQSLGGSEDVSGGYTMASIAAGETVHLVLDTIEGFISGASAVTITGGALIEAALVEYA